MLLYLIRHAKAVDLGDEGIMLDEDRHLTDEGRRRTRHCGKALKRLDVRIDEIWTSPLVRCRQTAEIVHESFDNVEQLRLVDALAPGSDFEAVTRDLGQTVVEGVALVGHEPDMGRLASWLITGRRHSVMPFKKGAVACIETAQFNPPRNNELLWFLTPKQLDAIGK